MRTFSRIRPFLFSLLAILGCSVGVARGAEPFIKDFGPRDYVRTSKELPHSEDVPWKLVCGMPYNCHFQPSIVVDGPAGRTIAFNSSNPLVLYLTKTESCTTEAGEHRYEAKDWISGEGAIHTLPAGVVVKSVEFPG